MSVSPKRPKGPPLNAMRAFEAAARHESFTAAADELNVTPGAVSQHVKTLEGWAATPLFRRNPQGIELTEAGRSLVAQFTRAFDAMADATQALRNLTPHADFHIAALPSVAQLWLPKRLALVRARFPRISFSVTALEDPPSLSRELFDLSIFFGTPDGTLDQTIVCPDLIAPVAAPALAARGESLGSVALLHDLTWADDWTQWSRAAGVALDPLRGGPQFSLYSLAVEEAKAGAGVLMGHLCLLEDALAAGTLARVHPANCDTGKSLILTLPHAARQRRETRAVVDLLLGQAAAAGI